MLPLISIRTASSNLTVLISVVSIIFLLLCVLLTRLMQLVNRRLCASLNQGGTRSSRLNRSHGIIRFNSRDARHPRNDTHRQRPIRFPSTILTSLASENESQTVCPICLDAFSVLPIAAGPCEHKMHAACLTDWLVKDRSQCCPICRACYNSDSARALHRQRTGTATNVRVNESDPIISSSGFVANINNARIVLDNPHDDASYMGTVCSSTRDSIPSVETTSAIPPSRRRSSCLSLPPPVARVRGHSETRVLDQRTTLKE